MPRADFFFKKKRSKSDADSEDNGEPDDPVNQDDGGEAQEEVGGAPMEADNHHNMAPDMSQDDDDNNTEDSDEEAQGGAMDDDDDQDDEEEEEDEDEEDDDYHPSEPSSSSSPYSSSTCSSSEESGSSSSSDDVDSSDDEFVAMQDHPIPADANDPLYEGAPLTQMQSFLMIHQHLNQFHPSRVEKESLLKLIKAHCPGENRCFDSLAQYENFLGNGAQYSSIHEYCGGCFHLYATNENECPDCHAARWLGGEMMPSFLLPLHKLTSSRCCRPGRSTEPSPQEFLCHVQPAGRSSHPIPRSRVLRSHSVSLHQGEAKRRRI